MRFFVNSEPELVKLELDSFHKGQFHRKYVVKTPPQITSLQILNQYRTITSFVFKTLTDDIMRGGS